MSRARVAGGLDSSDEIRLPPFDFLRGTMGLHGSWVLTAGG